MKGNLKERKYELGDCRSGIWQEGKFGMWVFWGNHGNQQVDDVIVATCEILSTLMDWKLAKNRGKMSGLVWVLVIKKHVDIPPHVSLFLPDVFGW